MQFARLDGVLVEPVGALWVAFSPATGETSLLNDESAAILEVLQDGPAEGAEVCIALATDSGLPADQLAPVIQAHWRQLLEAGLVRSQACAEAAPT